MTQSELTEQDNVQVAIIEALLIQSLPFLQINDLTEIENSLDHVQIELAEDRMVVVQAQMADIDLNFLVSSCLTTFAIPVTKLLSYLKEALFDLSFNTRLQLLLHVVQLQVLSFEVLEWVAFLIVFTPLHVLHDWFFGV